MATRLIWFAKNSMQHNHDETVMSGIPETPRGRSWQPATGEASQAAATSGANDGVIPNPPSGRLALDHVTKERRQKRATLPRKKKNIMHIGTWNVCTMRGLGKLDLLDLTTSTWTLQVCVRLDGMEKGIFSMVNIQ